MKKFLLFLLIAFVACIKLEDIDFGPILKEMRDYRLVFAKKNETDDSTSSDKNSTKNDSDTTDSTGYNDTTSSTDTSLSSEDGNKKHDNIFKKAMNWLREHAKLEEIGKALVEAGKAVAINLCSGFVDREVCKSVVDSLIPTKK